MVPAQAQKLRIVSREVEGMMKIAIPNLVFHKLGSRFEARSKYDVWLRCGGRLLAVELTGGEQLAGRMSQHRSSRSCRRSCVINR